MKLVVGLGNPGARYRGTRHNVGFDVLDELARREAVLFETSRWDALEARLRDASGGARLMKPLTFMNLSGSVAAAAARYYRVEPEGLLVVADDVSLPLGRLRARASGSAGGHKGLASIIEALGTDAFPRLRVGVGRGDPRRDLADHVLARFEPGEQEAVEAMIARAADAAAMFLAEGIAVVMNRFNAGAAEPDRGAEARDTSGD
ncbi:MAG TPA: aminoacyl-tRNA hydrolase [Vicinamibacterales bacterium]|nr:aminoacyl-tRNA hydrolase [Vicinamibacterales bacterium]